MTQPRMKSGQRRISSLFLLRVVNTSLFRQVGMSRLPSASTSRRVSTKDLLHGILHTCEQELASNMAISAYPLVRKKQFVRSLNRVAVRIGRFLALYRCHISSEVVLRGTRGSGSYLKVSDRASALMWEVFEEIRLKH